MSTPPINTQLTPSKGSLNRVSGLLTPLLTEDDIRFVMFPNY